MKTTKHSEERIIGVVKEMEAGRPKKELARELGVTDQMLYNWKSKYGGMEVSAAYRLSSGHPEAIRRRAWPPIAFTQHSRTLPKFAESC